MTSDPDIYRAARTMEGTMETPTFDPEPRLSRLHPDLQREILRAREHRDRAFTVRGIVSSTVQGLVVPLVAYLGAGFFGATSTSQLAALILVSTAIVLANANYWATRVITETDITISISEWMALNLNKEKL